MYEPFVAEIRIFPFNFAPTGWAFCNGQLMPISQNTALFSLLGTTYGGDGRTTFGLPNLSGRMPSHPGPTRVLGEQGGSESVTLISSNLPAHTHPFVVRNATAGSTPSQSPANAFPGPSPVRAYAAAANTTLSPQALGFSGGSSPHNNMSPYLALNFCIAMFGVFPPRN